MKAAIQMRRYKTHAEALEEALRLNSVSKKFTTWGPFRYRVRKRKNESGQDLWRVYTPNGKIQSR